MRTGSLGPACRLWQPRLTVFGRLPLRTAVGVSSKIFAAVSDFNLRMICFGANPHNLSFLVNETDSDDVVRKLHTALFE